MSVNPNRKSVLVPRTITSRFACAALASSNSADVLFNSTTSCLLIQSCLSIPIDQSFALFISETNQDREKTKKKFTPKITPQDSLRYCRNQRPGDIINSLSLPIWQQKGGCSFGNAHIFFDFHWGGNSLPLSCQMARWK